MVAGLTRSEELNLALAKNQRYRAALEIAVRGLSTAHDRGFQEATGIIDDVNAALSQLPLQSAPPPPLWPQFIAWMKGLSGKSLG